MTTKHITVLPPASARAICACCLLGPAMRDCHNCEFQTFKAPPILAAIEEPASLKALKALPDSNPTLSAA
jgi:hypothetical protein